MPVPFSKPVQVCTTKCPVWDSGGGLSLSSVLKVFGVLVRIICTHAQLRVSPEVHTQLYGVIFLSSFLSALLVLSSSLGLPFLVLWPEIWGFSYTFCHTFPELYPNLGPSSRKAETEKSNWISPHLLGITERQI